MTTWTNDSVRGNTKTAVMANLAAAVATTPNAPQDGRIEAMAAAALAYFPEDAPAGLTFFVNTSGRDDPDSEAGWCNVNVGLTRAA